MMRPIHLLRQAQAVVQARWTFRSVDSLGPRVRVWGRPRAENSGTMIIGERVRVSSGFARVEFVSEPGGVLQIGARTFVNFGTTMAATLQITIGERCNIGPFCMLMDNAYHEMDPSRRDQRPPSSPITLGHNVWLGARVIVLPGVSIGENSVIGAGSVVSRNVPPNVFAAGMPARVIRSI